MLRAASALIGLDADNPLIEFIEEIVDGDDQPPEYIFVGRTGRARVTAKQLVEFRYCDAAVTAATDEVVDHLTPTEWRKARRALLKAKTQVVLGPEAASAASVKARLFQILRAAPSVLQEFDGADADYIRAHGYPFRKEGVVWYAIDHFFQQLETFKIRHDRREVVRGFRALGITESKRVWFRESDLYEDKKSRGRRSCTLYRIPERVVAEALGLDG